MSDIFLSYAKEDREWARLLEAALTKFGWTVFWDQGTPPGVIWRERIYSELKEASCVLVAWSKTSIQSEWVLEEAEVGKSKRILIPVLIESVEPPFGFRSLQALNLSDWNGKTNARSFKLLVEGMQRVLGMVPDQEESPKRLGGSSSKEALREGKTTKKLPPRKKKTTKKAAQRQKKPMKAIDYYQRGIARSLAGKNDQAIYNYRQSIELDPAFVDAYVAMGVELSFQGNDVEAIEAWGQALEIDPTNVNAYQNLSDHYGLVGDYETAISYGRSAIELQKEDQSRAFLHWDLGKWLRQIGHHAESATEFEKAKKLGYEGEYDDD